MRETAVVQGLRILVLAVLDRIRRGAPATVLNGCAAFGGP